MTENIKQTVFIVFLPQEWEIYHRRPYWEAMAEHSEILLVEPPAGILTAWARPERIKDIFRKTQRIEQFRNNIYLFRPYQLLSPGYNFIVSFFNAIDRLLMRRQLKKQLKRLNKKFDKMVTFIVHVHQQHLSKVLADSIQCYEITDLYLIPHGHHKLDTNHWYTKRASKCETKLVKESNLVITSSRLIYDKLKADNNNIHYLPNAADYNHFVKSTDDALTVPDELNRIPQPRLGFIGYINHLIDFELIAKLAIHHPQSSIVLIGGEQAITKVTYDSAYRATFLLENVYYLGFKKYEMLPAYLKGFDICLMPFRLNEWMKHSAPNKTYQYLASGKPVISTDFTEIRQYSDIVYVAKDHNEFIKLVGVALSEQDESKKKERQRIAKENSTENRALKILELIAKSE